MSQQNDIKVEDDALPYVIVVGDEYAAIWWDGEHWTHDPSKALHIIEWKEAKRLMSELRNSRLSTIRTDNSSDLKAKPTIEDLESIMDANSPTPTISILPNGEVVVGQGTNG